MKLKHHLHSPLFEKSIIIKMTRQYIKKTELKVLMIIFHAKEEKEM